MKRGPKPRPLAERFWAKVDKNGPTVRPELGPCWLWTAGGGSSGYGAISRGARRSGMAPAHLVSWELSYGPLEPGKHPCHKCDVRRCVRPEHLFSGTQQENIQDAYAKGRCGPQVTSARSRWIGSRNPTAILTPADVKAIREQAATGGRGTRARLAKEFHVRDSAISKIVKRLSWAHVD